MQELTFDSDAVEVVALPELGARLHRLRVFGRDLLRTPADPGRHLTDPFFWGAYVMAPWCNRLQAGRVQFGSRHLDLAANFPDGTAIHGQVYARAWAADEDGSLEIRAGGDGWPWRYAVTQRIKVDGRCMRLELRLTNLDDEPMPAGIGVHPWFRRPDAVAIHARGVYPDNLQTDAQPQPLKGRFDLRRPSAMPADVDATWAGLSDPAAEIRWGGVRAVVRVEADQAFVVAASPSDLEAVALEAQTHAPQGFRRLVNGEPGAMTLLEPGELLELALILDFEELPASD